MHAENERMAGASRKWHWLVRLSHWTTLVLLVPLFYTGLTGRMGHFNPSETHANLGVALLVVLLVRLLTRAVVARPAGYRSRISALVQVALYAVLFGLLISGVAAVQNTAFLPRATVLGGLEIPTPGLVQPQLAGVMHRWLGYVLLGLVGVHVASAVWRWAGDRSFLSRIV
jgi:cytochrome b561